MKFTEKRITIVLAVAITTFIAMVGIAYATSYSYSQINLSGAWESYSCSPSANCVFPYAWPYTETFNFYSYVTSAVPVGSATATCTETITNGGEGVIPAQGYLTCSPTIVPGAYDDTNPADTDVTQLCAAAAASAGLSTSNTSSWCDVEYDETNPGGSSYCQLPQGICEFYNFGAPYFSKIVANVFTTQPTTYTDTYVYAVNSSGSVTTATFNGVNAASISPGANPSASHAPAGQHGCYSTGVAVQYTGTGNVCQIFTPAVAATPATATLSASPTSVPNGTPSTLSWGSTNATSCTGTNFSTGNATSGSLSVSPSSTTNYSVTCTGAGGTSAPATATVTVTAAPKPTASLTATPSSITSGGSSTIGWTCTNSTSSTGTNFSTGGAVSGSTSVSPVATTTYSLLCTGSGGTGTTTKTVNVAPAILLPDLTVTGGAPAVANVGSPVSLTENSYNQGTGTALNFPNFIQLCNNSGCSSILSQTNANTIASLAVSASSPITLAYTATTTGTWYWRACTNYNQTWGGSITEGPPGNMTNNCGNIESLVVSPATNSISSCIPSPSSATTGQTVTWTVTTAGFSPAPTSYTWSGGGTPSSQTSSATTFASYFASAGSYSPSVSATNGTQSAGPTSCTPVTISGTGGSCSSPPTGFISPSENRVNQTTNTGVTLSFSAQGIPQGDTCSISGPGLSPSPFTTGAANSSCVIATSTTATSQLSEQSVYTMTCTGWSGSFKTEVNVVPQFTEF